MIFERVPAGVLAGGLPMEVNDQMRAAYRVGTFHAGTLHSTRKHVPAQGRCHEV